MELTVLGGGTSGLALIEKMREKDTDCRIKLIEKNSFYFPRSATATHPDDSAKRVDLKEWAQNKGIEFIQDRIEKVNLRRRKIYLKEKSQVGFEKLVIATGLVSKKLSLKGEHRQGFFYLSGIDPLKLNDFLKLAQEVCVYVSTFLGVRFALALACLKKDVSLVCASLDFLGEERNRVAGLLKEKGISLYCNSSIEEAVGEGTVKAVKISPLKIFSAQLVFIDSGFLPNRDFFEEELALKDIFFTGFEGVYLLGDVNRQDIEEELFFIFNQEEAKEQAAVLADFLLEGTPLISQRKLSSPEDKQRTIGNILKGYSLCEKTKDE